MAAERIAEAALPEPRILKPVEVPLKSEQAAHDVATRFALCRAISRSVPAGFLRPAGLQKCEWSLFLVRLVQPSIEMIIKQFAQETDCCHA